MQAFDAARWGEPLIYPQHVTVAETTNRSVGGSVSAAGAEGGGRTRCGGIRREILRKGTHEL